MRRRAGDREQARLVSALRRARDDYKRAQDTPIHVFVWSMPRGRQTMKEALRELRRLQLEVESAERALVLHRVRSTPAFALLARNWAVPSFGGEAIAR